MSTTLIAAEVAEVNRQIERLRKAFEMGDDILSLTAQSLSARDAQLIAAVLTVRLSKHERLDADHD